MFSFDTIIPREGTDCFKFDFRKQIFGRDDVIPMWVADMDFAVPPFVEEAIRQRAMHPIYGYSIIPDSYYQSIIDWQKRHHNWEIRQDWILYSPGIVTALNLMVQALTEPGDGVITQSPVYFPFFWAAERNNRKLLVNQLIERDGIYSIDFDDLEQKMKSGAKMLIISSPHNPVGRNWTPMELEKIGQLCVENKVILVSDEIHCDLVMPDFKHTPSALLSEEIHNQTITCIATSKTFNLAGLFTASVVVPNDSWRRRLKMQEEKIHLPSNIFGIIASEAAYRYGDQWLNDLLFYLQNNRSLVNNVLKEHLPMVTASPLEATYLMWLDFRRLGMTEDQLKEILIGKAGVGLQPGSMFGQGGNGFMRMNIGCQASVLEEALRRIVTTVKEVC